MLGEDKDKSTWDERPETFDYDSFDRHLGDKAVDEWGRKRRASNLADDLTKEGVEAYFEERQRQAEAQTQPEPTLARDAESATESDAVAEEPMHHDSPSYPSFGTYFVTESDVGQVARLREEVDAARANFCAPKQQAKELPLQVPDPALGRVAARQDRARRSRPRVPHDGGRDGHDVVCDDLADTAEQLER